MKVGIIGSAGFIGSHVYEAVEALGWEAAGFDVKGTESPYTDHPMDVTDGYQVGRQLGDHELDAVINLAGLLGTSELFDDVQSAIDVNITGQYNVAQACLDLGIPMVTIEQPHVWTNPYEATRGAGVRLARALAFHKGLKLATVTTYNAFGERQAFGEGHPQKIVPTFALNAWRNEPLPIWGTGEQLVNMVYAGDIAKVMIDAIDQASSQVPILMGASASGNMSVNKLARMMWKYARGTSDFDSVHLPMRDGEDDDDLGASIGSAQIMAHNTARRVHVPRFDVAKLYQTMDWYKEYA